jgi:hypothetical protein
MTTLINKSPFNLGAHWYSMDGVGKLTIDANLILIDGQGTILQRVPYSMIPITGDCIPKTWWIKWKQVTEIRISLDVDYEIMTLNKTWGGMKKSEGSYRLLQPWRVVYGEAGILTEPLPSYNVKPAHGSGDYAVQVLPLIPDQNPHEAGPAYVAVVLKLIGGSTDDGVSVGVKGVDVNIGKSSSSSAEDYRFKTIIQVSGRPEKSEQITLPDELLRHAVYFDEPTKPGKTPGEDQPNLNANELRRLQEWRMALQSRAKELYWVIGNGECPIVLTGYASTTGTPQYDLEMSKKRIVSVREAIRGEIKNPKIKFSEIPKGHGSATQSGPQAREKRVEIYIDSQAAQRAIAANKGKI